MPPRQRPFSQIFGVDFSGAKLAGLNIWIARLDLKSRKLTDLDRLGALAGADDRETALPYLVKLIRQSNAALWGIDFPFALPLEVVDAGWGLADQLTAVSNFKGDAYEFGRVCVDRARKLGGKLHLRRTTDVETRTPFDCYHYRIICQTFHGMRDVLLPLREAGDTRIAPFDPPMVASRAVVESCPGSTLKRWGVPHNNYKQPAGGPLEPKRLRNRKIILTKLREYIEIDDRSIRIIQRNAGADALDAVIAAVGAWQAWETADWGAIAEHPRYSREGMIFA